jgi:large subunit ribosomal protein LP0
VAKAYAFFHQAKEYLANPDAFVAAAPVAAAAAPAQEEAAKEKVEEAAEESDDDMVSVPLRQK